MALITCPECGRRISEYAPECKGCGIPMDLIKKSLAANIKANTLHKNKSVNCVICGTTYDFSDSHCPFCKFPVLSLSSKPDNSAIYLYRGMMNGKSEPVDLSEVLLIRPYTFDELEKTGKTIPFDKLAELVSKYREFASRGNIFAQTNLGMLYDRGYGVKNDKSIAKHLLKKPAERGIAEAQYFYGRNMFYTKGSEYEGVNWIRKSAEQGFPAAQYSLAVLYAQLGSSDKEYREAVKWYRKAAEQGISRAYYDLGVLYEKGLGVEQDIDKAIEYYSMEPGNKEAQERIQKLKIKQENAVRIEKLESELFGSESISNETDYADKKIDKFYDMYRKNEEYQKLLDEEYNKLKNSIDKNKN